MPENGRLQIKVEEIRDIMNGVHKPRRRQDKQDDGSADTPHDTTTPHDTADTTFISSSGNGSLFLGDPSAASTSTSSKKRVSEQPPMTEEQRTRVTEELVRIVNTGEIKKIKGIKGIGAKRAEKIVDYVDKKGSIVNVEELVAAGLSETVVNTVIKVCLLEGSGFVIRALSSKECFDSDSATNFVLFLLRILQSNRSLIM